MMPSFKRKSVILMTIIFILIFFSGTNVDVVLHLKPNVPYDEWAAFYHFAPADWLLLIFFLITMKKIYLIYTSDLRLIIVLLFAILLNMIWGLDSDLRNFIPALCIPPLFSILLQYYNTYINKTKVIKFIYFFFYIECGIAIIEKIFMIHLFPQVGIAGDLFDLDYSGEFRSTALLGHPLANATVITLILSFILLSNKPFKRKLLYWLLGFLAILCFNTRMAIVLNIGVFTIYCSSIFFYKNTSIWNRTYIIVFLLISGCIIGYAISKGFGGRLINMGLYDEGSASVRMDIWDIFDYYSVGNLLYRGIDFVQLNNIMFNAGVGQMIIENFWLVFLLRFGFLMLILMTIAYCLFFRNLSKGLTIRQCLYIYIPFLIQTSSFNSIATGSNILSFLVLFLFVFRGQLIIQNKKI